MSTPPSENGVSPRSPAARFIDVTARDKFACATAKPKGDILRHVLKKAGGAFAGDLNRPRIAKIRSSTSAEDDFEQSPLEPIESVGRISSYKRFTGFEVMPWREAAQSRGQGLGQTWQYCG